MGIPSQGKGQQTSSPLDLNRFSSKHNLQRKIPLNPTGSCWPHRGTLDFLHHISLPPDCIDLLDEMGALMTLNKVESPASEFTSKYLWEREHYILIRVIRKFLGKTAQFSL